MSKKVKVVMAKLGLDIHWRGAMAVSRLLRDAGMEVVYIGNKFPEEIVEIALQEGADVIGLSTLCGNHMTLGPKVVDILKQKGAGEIIVLIGGVIPPEDFQLLRDKGLTEVFGPETPIEKITKLIHSKVAV